MTNEKSSPPGLVAAFMLGLFATGCGGSGDHDVSRDDTVVRDSAGIRIVSTASPAGWQDGGWRVDPEPLLVLGGDQATGAEAFGSISDAKFLPGGGVAVVDALSRRVHLFGAQGEHRRTFGRAGEGPGEFTPSLGAPVVMSPEFLTLAVIEDEERILVRDRTRVLEFDLDGRFHGATDMSREVPGLPSTGTAVWEVLSDASVFVNVRDLDTGAVAFGVFAAGGENYVEVAVSESSGFARAGRMVVVSPFSAAANATPRTEPLEVFVADRVRPEIRTVGPDGELRRIFRYSPPRPAVAPLLPSARAAFEAEYSGRPDEQDLLAAFAELQHPDTLAAVGAMLWDEAGFLWVERFRPRGSPPVQRHEIDVLGERGEWVGTLNVPFGLRSVADLRYDRLIVFDSDALGSDRIRVHQIQR